MIKEDASSPFGINQTKRYVSKNGESILFKQDQIGNTGLVELVDYMGGDGTVERVATAGHGSNIFPEKPSRANLIRHLVASGTYQPFSSVQLKFHIQTPIEEAHT